MKALILVDIQNDFLPGGNLAVPEGDEIIEVANKLKDKFDMIIATKDWHPKNHKSFAGSHPGKKPGDIITLNGIEQILWTEHCAQNSYGASFPENLNQKMITKIFHKGTDENVDSYSGFLDNDRKRKTGLDEYLKENNISEIYIMGLATDYCVKFTALDGLDAGYKVYLIADGCRGVNIRKNDVENAIKEMKQKGVILINSNEI